MNQSSSVQVDTPSRPVVVLGPGDVLVTQDRAFLVMGGRVDCYPDGSYQVVGKVSLITSQQADDLHEYQLARVFETTAEFVGLWRQV